MAQVIEDKKLKAIEVADGNSIVEACTELGVPFSCEDGYCGTCVIDIVEGEENLSELTDDEENLGMDRTRRLACQCRIKEGEVRIKI